jgi:hypothetical protein
MKETSRCIRRLLSRKGGYFLIELLISAVILVGGILFILDSLRIPVVVARRSLSTLQATAIGSMVGDRIIRDSGGYTDHQVGERSIGNTVYSWEVREETSVIIGSASERLRLLTVEVRWQRNGEHRVRLPILCKSEEGY